MDGKRPESAGRGAVRPCERLVCLWAADVCRAGLAAVLVLVIRPKVMRKC